MRVYALYCAILVYAVFSSPTPDHFGAAEIIITLLVLFSIHPVQTLGTITENHLPAALNYHRLFILWMVSVPFIIGAVNGYGATDIMRDMIPLLCLILPFAFINQDLKSLPNILMIAGGCLATRYCILAVPHHLMIGIEAGSDSLLYLANAPLVMFAALYGFHLLIHPARILFSTRLIGLCTTVTTLLAMAMMIQRAPLAFCLIGFAGIVAVRFFQTPVKITLFMIMLGFLIMPFIPLVTQVMDGFITKTLTVGTNSRTEEFIASLRHLSFFGMGWGSEWQSPAVGDYWVRYTHNMVSYYGLKTGFIGMIFAIGFMFVWLSWSFRIIIRHDFAIGIALFIPLLIHMTLYTGYKTFDFALLIMMIFLWIKDRAVFLSSTEPSRPPLAQRGGSRAILPSICVPKDIPSPS